MARVRFTKKNDVRLFSKSDYPNNYVTNPERYQYMLGELAEANREVERDMNSPTTTHITRKRHNKWSPATAKQRANDLADMLHVADILRPQLYPNRHTKKHHTKKRKAKKTHGHKYLVRKH